MGLYSNLDSNFQCNSPDGQHLILKDFGDMIRGDDQPSPPSGSRAHSVSSTPPATPLTPGTPVTPGASLTPGLPLGPPPSTPSNPGSYRNHLPSFTESDSQSSTHTYSDTASDSQSDGASVCSGTEWANFDISPLVKEELKQAIVARRKTQGLPEFQVNFDPKPSNKLTPEEEERREVQKERNRTAAAKCRKKKRHSVDRLLDEAQDLEKANAQLREEMQALETEREKLQFLLAMHSPKCLMEATAQLASGTSHLDTKRTRVSASTSGGPSPVYAWTTQTSTATTPSAESSSGYSSSAYMSPTPTTCSHSSAEPTTPTILTPTSVKDVPVFPTTGTELAMTAVDIPPSFTTQPALQTTPIGLDPTAPADTFSGCAASDIFPPAVPPTPDIDDDDPLSASFVKEYLGDEAFRATDLSLDDAACMDSIMLIPLQTIDEFDPDNNHESLSGNTIFEGATGVLSTDREAVGIRTLSHPASGQITRNKQSIVHDPSTFPQPIHSPGESHLTLSFSALLGVSPQEMEGEMDTGLSSPTQSAIDPPVTRSFQETYITDGATLEEHTSNRHEDCSLDL